MPRAKRYWHVAERYGYFYAENQFGGFTRCGTRAEAEALIDSYIAEFGDERAL